MIKQDTLKYFSFFTSQIVPVGTDTLLTSSATTLIKLFIIGSHLYVSAEGEFEVFVDNKKVNSFGPGRAFGELAILYNTKRNATIRGKVVPILQTGYYDYNVRACVLRVCHLRP
jgi:CRP-like cAMP-binding protein